MEEPVDPNCASTFASLHANAKARERLAMVEKLDKIWMDGELVDWDLAKVHVLTHSLHYGVAAFEGIRVYNRAGGAGGALGGPHIFRLGEHIDRLLDSCKMALIPPRFSRGVIMAACVELTQRNRLTDCYVRPIVYVADGAMGVYAPDNPVRTAVMAWKWGVYLGEDGINKGIRCKISSFARHHVNVSLAKGKITGQYTNSVLAKREAKMAGYDEALMLDPSGYLSEGSGENVFIVKGGTLMTPDLSCSILEGITRDTILNLAREEKIRVVEGRITRDQLWLADEAFLTGTAAEVTPIREVDNRVIGDGKVGPVTRRLQDRYFDVVRGKDTAHPEWLTRV
jgi:branched-chain amino acid aminotransferase